jgi:galactitol PTS system EIIA component
MTRVHKDFIKVNLIASDREEVILSLANLLELKGVVNMQFGKSAILRERSFPTGIPTQPFAIAFPHADSTTVYRASLAIGTLAQPVFFKSMEDPQKDLPVRAVFLLASRNPREQVSVLRQLSRFFKKPENLNQLLRFSNEEEVVAWLENGLFQAK